MLPQKKIIFVFALAFEARPFLQALKLKKKRDIPFRVFENEDSVAIISGSGKVASAAATSFISCQYSAEKIINIGISGARNEEIGKIFQIAKIVDNDTKRSFYPDLFEPFLQDKKQDSFFYSICTTVSIPDTAQSFENLVDMEASGFYESASKFFPAHKIYLFKIVSDDCSETIIDINKAEEIITKSVDCLLNKKERKKQEEQKNIFVLPV